MENSNFTKYTISFGLSLALASVLDALLVIAKERIPAVMTGLQKMTGHHWISHAIIVLGFFALFGWALAQGNGGRRTAMTASRLITIMLAGVALASLLIMGFYLTMPE